MQICKECAGLGETLLEANESGGVPQGGIRTCQSCWGGSNWRIVSFEQQSLMEKAVKKIESQFPKLKELLRWKKI